MSDLPPPYTALTRHAMMPRVGHDEAARFNFLTHFNRYLSGAIGQGNRLAYERRVLPAFREKHGRDPQDRHEVREAMNRDPWHRSWSALKRNSMEMRQHNGRQIVLRQLDELDAKAREYNERLGQLELDEGVEQPWYQRAGRHSLPAGRLPFGGAAGRRCRGRELRHRHLRHHRRRAGRAERWRRAGGGRMGAKGAPRLATAPRARYRRHRRPQRGADRARLPPTPK